MQGDILLVSICFLIIASLYATGVYLHPPETSQSVWYVVIGSTMSGAMMSWIIFIILRSSGLWPDLWGLVIVPFFCYGVTGGPMILGQLLYKLRMSRRYHRLTKRVNSG